MTNRRFRAEGRPFPGEVMTTNNIKALLIIMGFAALIAGLAGLAHFASERGGNNADDADSIPSRDEYITNKFNPWYRFDDRTRFRSHWHNEAAGGNHEVSDRTPRWTPDGKTVIVNIGSAIYGASTDGGALWRIPEGPIQEQFGPVVRSDGLVVYLNFEYHRDTGSFTRHIETALPDGTGRHRLARLPGSESVTRASSPSWSPDGRFIGVAMYGSEVAEGETVAGIHVVSLDGTVTWLDALHPTFPVWGLDWSPDGKHLAILVMDDGPVLGQWDAEQVNLVWEARSPTEARQHISHLAWAPTGDHIYYAVSGGIRTVWGPPEHRRIYFAADGIPTPHMGQLNLPVVSAPPETGAELLVVDVGTQEKRPVADIRPERVIRGLQVSPDGQRILLTAALGVKYHPVQVMNIDGSEPRDLCCELRVGQTRFGGLLWASWSPSGERVAILDLDRKHEVALRTMRPDGSDEKILIRWNEDGTLAPGQPR